MRVLLISKITGIFGAALFIFPGPTLFVLHLLWARIPGDLPFMDRYVGQRSRDRNCVAWFHPDIGVLLPRRHDFNIG